jgi:hypothetical protein
MRRAETLISCTVSIPRSTTMHVSPNVKTKKALKEAIARGDEVRIVAGPHEQGNFTGTAFLEGPWDRHMWYGKAEVVDGKVVKVK